MLGADAGASFGKDVKLFPLRWKRLLSLLKSQVVNNTGICGIHCCMPAQEYLDLNTAPVILRDTMQLMQYQPAQVKV